MKASTAGIVLSLWSGAMALAQARGPYQQNVAEIMERQGAADLAAGPRVMPPVFSARRRGLPQNPASAASSRFPAGTAFAASPSPGAPQTPGVSFLGAALSDTNSFPPDSMGAAGPSQFLVGVNGRIRTFVKSSGAADGVLNADMDVFFDSVRNSQPTTGPHVRYDRLSGRWIVSIVGLGATFSNNRVLIAASDSGTITASTVWTFSYFQHNLDTPAGDTDLFLDSATLGVDANALVIGGNILDGAGAFQGTSVHVVRKSAAISGGGGNLVPGSVVALRNLTGTVSGAGPYAPQGVDNLRDAASTGSWVIGVDNASFGTLMLRKISFSAPGAWPPTGISGNLSLAVPSTAVPLTVPHLGNTGGADGQLDALDDRLSGASLRDGHIWTAHNIAVTGAGVGSDLGDRDGSRWYEVDVGGPTPSLVQSGTLYDAAGANPDFYWIPSVAVSGQGHAAIAASIAGSARHVDASTAGRLSGDAAGSLRGPLSLTASATAYNPPADPGPPRRWGDYSRTSVDPQDDMTMWTIQEYCNATNSYGVRVVELVAPPPANLSSATPNSIGSGLLSASVLITGSSATGAGFFDPGPGYPNRLQATVSGGDVGVNGVTYTDPYSITLELNTVGAALGPRSVTITNPDGQSTTSLVGFLTIAGAGSIPTVTSIAPTSGPASGGTVVHLTGTNFVTGANVTVGDAAATGVNVTSASSADAATPALSPGTLDDVMLFNPSFQDGTLSKGWFADFLDVPQADGFHDFVEAIFRMGITAGVGGGNYGRNQPVTRAQMAVFLLAASLGSGYVPPDCSPASPVFSDVPCPDGFAVNFIEDLFHRGIAAGYPDGTYGPNDPVTRAQMAVFLLVAKHGSGYVPPACSPASPVFADVPCPDGFAVNFIEKLHADGVTGGCDTGPLRYCPDDPATRGEMAVFLTVNFAQP